jgi:hypothetical protein
MFRALGRKRLRNKIALVAGATRGAGRAKYGLDHAGGRRGIDEFR